MKAKPAPLLRLMASVVLPLALLSSQDPQRSPTFRTEANHVRVEVFATGRGVSVTDLRKGDFELFEDGQRQEIEEFEHVAVPARQTTSREAIAQAIRFTRWVDMLKGRSRLLNDLDARPRPARR